MIHRALYPALRMSLLAAVVTGLAGCSAISALGSATSVLDAYELRAPEAVPEARRSLSRDLVIEVPNAGGALATDRILVRPHPLQAQYLPDASWTATAPEMVQTLLVRVFENTNALRYVGRRPLGSSGDFALVSELTDFQAEAVPGATGATVRMRLVARLVRESDATVIASRSFQATAPAASLDTLVLVEAFNAASDAVLADLAVWALGRLGVGPRG